MTSIDFDQELSRLTTEFKAWTLTPGRAAMVWAAVKDLERQSLTKVINHMIATFRRPPVPQDFIDALASERRVYASSVPDQPFEPACKLCQDLGVLMGSVADWEGLALCKCAKGEMQLWDLPTIDDLRHRGPPRLHYLPSEPFKPKFEYRAGMSEDDAEFELGQAINERRIWWRESLRIAEEAWVQYRMNEN